MQSAPHTTGIVREIQGFEVYVLQNEHLEIGVVPELGAKVVSLINRRTGRDWMWRPAVECKLFRSRLGDDFANSTMTGWDECLPTIAPCAHRGRQLPDHGEIWSVPWQLDSESWRQAKVRTTVALPVSPFDFERTVALDGNAVRVDYRLRNRNGEPEEFLWAMHPLLPVFAGDALQLTPETRQHLSDEPWIDSLEFAPGQPACAKRFAGPLREGRAAVGNAQSGDRIAFAWDTRLNDTLGLWLTRGGWNGYHHLALEPTNGCPDALEAASAQRRCGIVPAHSTLSWQIAIQVDPAQTL